MATAAGTWQGRVLDYPLGSAKALLNESLQHTFVRYVDELTEWHLSLLDCIADVVNWAERHGVVLHQKSNLNAATIFEAGTRDTLPTPELNGVMLQDLLSRGLCTTGVNPYGPLMFHDEEGTRPRITDIGQRFLSFITLPKP